MAVSSVLKLVAASSTDSGRYIRIVQRRHSSMVTTGAGREGDARGLDQKAAAAAEVSVQAQIYDDGPR